ncbi:hypothetical protein O3P69_006181 [Scylla paramamosain]|uniref:Chromo domain-containing protein n=1 Tax=Scylla paramamosain TaxID=85552 RepID=A0AAW0UAF8_SCYPA
MGNKNKQNGEAGDADSTPPKDEDVGAEGDETTDDEGGVDTPPPQKDEEEQEDAQNEDGTFENAMAPKKRPAEGAEMTMQTRKAMRFSYSELDEDQDEVMPAGTRTRKVKVKPEPKPRKPVPPKKRQPSPAKSVGRPPLKKEPEEYEVEAVVDHRVRGRFTEYKVRWKGFGPKDDSWVPEAELNCDNLLNKYFKIAGRKVEESYEVQEIMDMREVKGRTEYKVRWKGWSAKYDSWLPEEELNCPDLLNRFHATHLKNVEEEEEKYEVEKILNERQKRGNKEYLVQWKNKGPKHNSWEPEENLENCMDAIKKFHDSQKKKKPAKSLKEVRKGRVAKAVEVEEEQEVESPARSRRTGKNRSYSEFYDQ